MAAWTRSRTQTATPSTVAWLTMRMRPGAGTRRFLGRTSLTGFIVLGTLSTDSFHGALPWRLRPRPRPGPGGAPPKLPKYARPTPVHCRPAARTRNGGAALPSDAHGRIWPVANDPVSDGGYPRCIR